MSRVITFGLHIADVLGRYVTDIPPGQGLDVIDEIRITVAGPLLPLPLTWRSSAWMSRRSELSVATLSEPSFV